MKNIFDKAIIFMGSRGAPFISDKLYISTMWKTVFKKPLNLDNPQTFNEKIQWLKLYDRKPEYTTMVDKCEAKKWAAERIGERYIIPTLGVWDRFEDINFDQLPRQFVLKTTHDSGGICICRNRSTFDFDEAKKRLSKSLRHNFYLNSREWPYKNVKPRIIAEKYMENQYDMYFDDSAQNNKELMDYKFYCFNGTPKFLYISKGLENHATASISFVTLDWEFEPFYRLDYKQFDVLPEKPTCFDEMIDIARILSSGTKFLRVDLYEINKNIYFGELTFSPNSGFMIFHPEIWDNKIGELLYI